LLGDTDLTPLACLAGLQELRLSEVSDLSDDSLGAIAGLEDLERLTLQHAAAFPNPRLSGAGECRRLSRMGRRLR
jgi:hypothetical protein